ncbi:hypothetical protein [Burkholderia plantarii]|uniref:hypothetical protein n=1 Tax=Burkholderia plantarii TaxID=41899 RepID=UPI000A8D2A81|nr:hypothetical protein [Burkholderia plantarii]
MTDFAAAAANQIFMETRGSDEWLDAKSTNRVAAPGAGKKVDEGNREKATSKSPHSVSADSVIFQLESFARLSSTSFDPPHMNIDCSPHFIDADIDQLAFNPSHSPAHCPSFHFQLNEME